MMSKMINNNLSNIKILCVFTLILLLFNMTACASSVKSITPPKKPILIKPVLKNETDSITYPVILPESAKSTSIPIKIQEESATPTTLEMKETIKDDLSTPSTTQTIDLFQHPPIQLLAAYLTEIGYFQGNIRQANLQEVESALKLFQRDSKLPETGKLDESLWKKLQSITLSDSVESQMFEKEENLTVAHFEKNEQVFAVEKVKCKSPTEAWILFYEGFIQEIQLDSLSIQLTKRYSLWYDSRYQGVSDENWWCIPSKQMCYSPIEFSDWGGTLKAGNIENFDKLFSIPYSLSITSLVPDLFKKVCQKAN
jgi:hypothetical protein